MCCLLKNYTSSWTEPRKCISTLQDSGLKQQTSLRSEDPKKGSLKISTGCTPCILTAASLILTMIGPVKLSGLIKKAIFTSIIRMGVDFT